MRQVFALVTEEQVQFALLDDDEGELTQFAQIKTPIQFGLAEAALLGTNLIEALGLNSRRPKPKPKFPDTQAEAEAAVAAKRKSEAAAEASDSGLTQKGTPRQRARPNPKHPIERYIPLDDVLAVIAKHPEGIAVTGIAQELMKDESEYPQVRISVANRVAAARDARRKSGKPLPWRETKMRDETIGKEVPKFHPLEAEAEQPQLEGGVFPWQGSSS